MTTNLRQRMTEDMQVRNLSPLTQSTYVLQVSMFARHFDRSPAVLGPCWRRRKPAHKPRRLRYRSSTVSPRAAVKQLGHRPRSPLCLNGRTHCKRWPSATAFGG
jgi:Phage integrase, N-terminal SAM-like domain